MDLLYQSPGRGCGTGCPNCCDAFDVQAWARAEGRLLGSDSLDWGAHTGDAGGVVGRSGVPLGVGAGDWARWHSGSPCWFSSCSSRPGPPSRSSHSLYFATAYSLWSPFLPSSAVWRCSGSSCSFRCSGRGCSGIRATNSGLVLTPMMLGAVVSSTLAGQFLSRWSRYRYLALAGMGIYVHRSDTFWPP